MEIRQLRYFITVAEHLNFTAAANELFVAQSVVSQQVAELENQLGVKLFDRNKRSVKLTSTGTLFFEEARDIVNRSDRVIQKFRQANLGLFGSVKLGYLNSAVKLFLPQIVRKFRFEFPHIDVNLEEYNVTGLTKALKNGEVDIAFTVGFKTIPGVTWEKIYSDYLSVVVHAEHHYANKARIDIASLTAESLIVISRQESQEGFDLILNLCANAGYTPKIIRQVSCMEAVLFLVESSIGVSIVPQYLKTNANSNIRFIDIEGENPTFDVVVAWQKDNTNRSVPIFLEKLRNENIVQ